MDKQLLTAHKIENKQCLIKICKRYGIKKWRAVYDADYNKAFRKKFPDPDYVLPKHVFYVPNKKKLVAKLTKELQQKKKKGSEMRKAVDDVQKAKKETEKRIVRQVARYETEYASIHLMEAAVMIFIPIVGAVSAVRVVMTGGQAAVSAGRAAVAMLTLLGLTTAKLTVSALDEESSTIVKVLKTANDYTSPGYWATTAWSDQGMDHNDFKKKGAQQLKQFNKQSDRLVKILDESIQTNATSTKTLEATLRELSSL